MSLFLQMFISLILHNLIKSIIICADIVFEPTSHQVITLNIFNITLLLEISQ